MRVPAKVEFTLCIGSAIEHQPVDVGVGDVAGKLLQLRPTRPGPRTDLRAFKLTRWMLRQSHPEACCLRTRGHIPAVSIVGVGDPEGGHRVVGRNQLIGGILTGPGAVQERLVELQGRVGLHLVRIPRLFRYWLPCSTPSSRK